MEIRDVFLEEIGALNIKNDSNSTSFLSEMRMLV